MSMMCQVLADQHHVCMQFDLRLYALQVLDDLVERLPEQFDMEDIRGRVDEFGPYVMVAIQVCCCNQCLNMIVTWSWPTSLLPRQLPPPSDLLRNKGCLGLSC